MSTDPCAPKEDLGPRGPKAAAPRDEQPKEGAQEAPPPKKKGSWNRIAIFAPCRMRSHVFSKVTASILVGGIAVGALYQLMLMKQLKKGPKAEKQPLAQDDGANPDLGETLNRL